MFRSPAVYAPYIGREATLQVLRAVVNVFEGFRYVQQIRDGDDEVLRFAARIGNRELEGVDLVHYGEDGLVTELTVLIRPRSGLQALIEVMATELAAQAALNDTSTGTV